MSAMSAERDRILKRYLADLLAGWQIDDLIDDKLAKGETGAPH